MYILALPSNESHTQEYYFYRLKNGKPQIFTFENMNEINTFLQMFQQWAIPKYIEQNHDPFGSVRIMSFLSEWEPIILKNPDSFTCDFVSFKEIRDEKGI